MGACNQPTTARQPEPGETLHRVLTDCPDMWRELDAEDKAMWAKDEEAVVVGARTWRGDSLHGEAVYQANQLHKLKALRGKMCTYGGGINFHDCEHVKRYMDELRKAEEADT